MVVGGGEFVHRSIPMAVRSKAVTDCFMEFRILIPMRAWIYVC